MVTSAHLHPDWLAIGVDGGDGTYYVYASRDIHRISVDPVMAHRPCTLDDYANSFTKDERVTSLAIKGWIENLVIGRGDTYAEAFAAVDEHFRSHPTNQPGLPAARPELEPGL